MNLIQLKDSSGNPVSVNGIGLFADLADIAGYVGIDTFEKVVQPETYATPCQEFGDELLVGNKVFKRVYAEKGSPDMWAYVHNRPLTVSSENMVVTGVDNTSISAKLLGTVSIPGDAARWGENTIVTVSVQADAPLTEASIILGMSTLRTSAMSKVEKKIVDGSSAVLEVKLTPIGATKVKIEAVNDFTAPTTYPTISHVADINLLGNVEFPVSFRFGGTAQATPTISLIGASASVKVQPPSSYQYDDVKSYRKAYEQPFKADDMWNMPIKDDIVVGRIGQSLNWATTGNKTSGSINASGIAGSDLIDVYSTEDMRVGEHVAFTEVYGPKSAIANGNTTIVKATATIAALGHGCQITEITSPTQIRVSQPVLTSFIRRGIEPWGAIYTLSSFSSAETLIARSGQLAGDMTKNPVTGIKKTGSKAIAYPSSVIVERIRSTDPIREWKFGKVLAWNGWIFKILQGTGAEAGNEAYIGGTFLMKTPSILTEAYLPSMSNADRNVVLITECGRYAIEHIYVRRDEVTLKYVTSRSTVTDLYSHSVSDILSRLELVNTGNTDGTRAYGGGLVGGIITDRELKSCPDSNATGETDEQIAANITQAMNAIPHAVAMVLASGQLKSNNYCPDPANQGWKVAFKAYKSQLSDYKPVVKIAGAGYKTGDVLYVVGGTGPVPMRLAVTGVDANGGVMDVFVTQTGQYKTLPADAGNLETTSSGAGIGCLLDVLSITTAPLQTTINQAFPNIGVGQLINYPATIVDGGWSGEYSGTIPMGSMFTIAKDRNLVTEWAAKRKTTPTAAGSSYEFLALMAAIQKYGAFCIDITRDTHAIAVVARNVDPERFKKMHGDTGSYTYPNLQSVKNSLLYVENVTPQGKGVSGALRAPMALDLFPINN